MLLQTYSLQGGIGAVAQQMAASLPAGCVELQQKVDKVWSLHLCLHRFLVPGTLCSQLLRVLDHV